MYIPVGQGLFPEEILSIQLIGDQIWLEVWMLVLRSSCSTLVISWSPWLIVWRSHHTFLPVFQTFLNRNPQRTSKILRRMRALCQLLMHCQMVLLALFTLSVLTFCCWVGKRHCCLESLMTQCFAQNRDHLWISMHIGVIQGSLKRIWYSLEAYACILHVWKRLFLYESMGEIHKGSS